MAAKRPHMQYDGWITNGGRRHSRICVAHPEGMALRAHGTKTLMFSWKNNGVGPGTSVPPCRYISTGLSGTHGE
jgi:hypothetical protein